MEFDEHDDALAARAEHVARDNARIVDEARDRARDHAEREKDAEQEARRFLDASKNRVTERLLRLAAGAPSELPEDRTAPSWIDPSDPQSIRRAELFDQDLTESSADKVRRWVLPNVEDQRAATVLDQYVQNVKAHGVRQHLVIQGPTGSGKTAAAIAAGRRGLELGLRVRFVSHANYITANYPKAVMPNGLTLEGYRRRYSDADLLIVDDLGASAATGQTITMDMPPEQVKSATEHAITHTMALIGDRASAGKYTLVTTNLRYLQLERLYGERFGSRLAQELVAVKMEGVDRRRPNTNW